jgi:hypothetical protein
VHASATSQTPVGRPARPCRSRTSRPPGMRPPSPAALGHVETPADERAHRGGRNERVARGWPRLEPSHGLGGSQDPPRPRRGTRWPRASRRRADRARARSRARRRRSARGAPA